MKVHFTLLALSDLQDLREYLEPRSQLGLANVIADIESTTRNIPGSITRGLRTPRDDVWEKISPNYKYRTPYYIQDEVLYVLRVYHPSRKPLDYKVILKLE